MKAQVLQLCKLWSGLEKFMTACNCDLESLTVA